jgi:hypothetical protein
MDGTGAMRALKVAIILVSLVVMPGHAIVQGAGTPRVLTVPEAYRLCAAHPALTEVTWLQGWNVADSQYSTYILGVLFASRAAVPKTTVDRFAIDGAWTKYHGIFTRITTRSTFSDRLLTLHGRLRCASHTFTTDRDPFPTPRIQTHHGRIVRSAGGPITMWATGGGMRLSLTVPRRIYPRNALARVTIRVQNVSTHVVTYLSPGDGLPGVSAPQVQALDRLGRVVFPPVQNEAPAIPGPASFWVLLHPGGSRTFYDLVIVRGARLRATLQFTPRAQPFDGVQYPQNLLATRAVTVGLTRADPPAITVRSTPSGPVADVGLPRGASRSLWWVSYADCTTEVTSPKSEYTFGWQPTGPHLAPDCFPLQTWYATVGRLNHTVAVLRYVAPGATPMPRSG